MPPSAHLVALPSTRASRGHASTVNTTPRPDTHHSQTTGTSPTPAPSLLTPGPLPLTPPYGNASQQYSYDAWNHPGAPGPSGTTLVTHSYDASYRRITEAPASGAPMDLYYSASWQVVEDRQSTHSSIAYQQYVWSPVYVDAMVLRDRDTNANGTLDERLYCLQDANFNVTSTTTLRRLKITQAASRSSLPGA